MAGRARAAAAFLLVLATCLVGVLGTSAPAHSVVAEPDGGCWIYVPSAPALDSDPASDVSTGLEPWTTEDGKVLLGSRGDTAAGGSREVILWLTSGPIVSAAAATGTASFLLSVDGTPLAAPLTASFSAAAGTPVRNLLVRGTIPVPAAGNHTIRLDAAYFDIPATTRRVACNGQTSGTQGGPNPATHPLPTDVETPFVSAAGASATIADVDGQDVTTSARAGDVVHYGVAGLGSTRQLAVSFCDEDGTCLDPVEGPWTARDGTANGEVVVPEGAEAGAGTLRISDGTDEPTVPLAVLGAPAVSGDEEAGTDTTVVTLTGTGWDPGKPVTISGRTGDDDATADDDVTADVDTSGGFTAEFEVTDEDTAVLAVEQAHGAGTLSAAYEFSGTVGTTPDSTDDPTTTPTTPATPGTTVTPPADIPLPGDVPVAEPEPAPAAPVDSPEELAVSEARLDGQATMSELFGGSPQRDLIFLVENVGDQTVEDPIVRVYVGRSTDLEPQIVDATVGVLEPGDRVVVTVPLTLPMAAFGTYHVVGLVGETEAGAFAVEWQTYPWGLIALDVLALALLAWGVRRRMARRRTAAAALVAGGDADAVVDLDAADAWWRYRSGTGPRPLAGELRVPGSGTPPPVEDPAADAIVDLDAAECWWHRNDASRAS